MPWATLQARLRRDWQPGQHVTIAAPTGIGKTHLAVSLAEMSRWVLVLACKRRDPLVAQLRQDGYEVTGNLDDLLWTAQGRGEPTTPKVVFWPQFSEKLSIEQRGVLQARAMREALNYADKTGGWTLLIDETMYMAASLRLEKELDHVWFQGRTQQVSIVACAQRPAHIPRMAFSQATYLFLGRFGDGRDIETLREISSTIPKQLLENAISTLSVERHEFLFVDVHREELAVVTAPPR
jgi:hypothetical protein